MTHRRLSAGVLATALALAGGTTGAVALEAPAYAGAGGKAKWLMDSSLATMGHVTDTIGAPAVWAKVDAAGQRVTGKGVGVALIDSGIAPVKGLAQSGKVINGPDLSFESQSSLANRDTDEQLSIVGRLQVNTALAIMDTLADHPTGCCPPPAVSTAPGR